MTPDGQSVAGWSADDRVRLWKTATGEHVGTLSSIEALTAWSSDGQLVACTNDDRGVGPMVEIFDAATRERVATLLEPLECQAYCVAFSPNSKMLAAGASCEDEAVVAVWDVRTGARLHSLEGHFYGTTDVQFSPDSTRLYSCGANSIVRVSSCETGLTLFEIEIERRGTGRLRFWGFALSSDGNHLATFRRQTIKLWDARTGTHYRTIRTGSGSEGSVASVELPDEDCAFSPDSRRIVYVVSTNRALFVDTSTGATIGSLWSGSDLFRGCHFTTSPFVVSQASRHLLGVSRVTTNGAETNVPCSSSHM